MSTILLLPSRGERDVDAVLVDRRPPLAHLVDQRQQRAAERDEVAQSVLRARIEALERKKSSASALA